ncbi:MAG: succinyl-CoA--3-ketoacid-CoA transferase, partial [Saprospiraceae bacterium]|nr:succinyl-CoA--3-ketoacid-CoA transferase [Saprospiraceae bacterium]
YIDLSILGALEVSAEGDLANWLVPGKRVPGVGGAMELAFGARQLIAVMQHVGKDGSPKIVRECRLPLTARKCVSRIITEKAVFAIESDGLHLLEIMEGSTLEDIVNCTEADLIIDVS